MSNIQQLVCRSTDFDLSFLTTSSLTVLPVTGDGLCLFRAIEAGLKNAKTSGITLMQIISGVKSEVAEHIVDYYAPFCLAGGDIIGDLDKYLNCGKFDQAIADVHMGY